MGWSHQHIYHLVNSEALCIIWNIFPRHGAWKFHSSLCILWKSRGQITRNTGHGDLRVVCFLLNVGICRLKIREKGAPECRKGSTRCLWTFTANYCPSYPTLSETKHPKQRGQKDEAFPLGRLPGRCKLLILGECILSLWCLFMLTVISMACFIRRETFDFWLGQIGCHLPESRRQLSMMCGGNYQTTKI